MQRLQLMKEIISVKKNYDASQLLVPADEMLKKLKKCHIPSLKKTAPICAKMYLFSEPRHLTLTMQKLLWSGEELAQ
ncbi:hypothetical protein VP01_775g2 [Puccinia sorghi]|uniref:Uncharacterized protein n=1 Tax=Puccinia sorghi TaxID=27349 RepID=A0A0L6UBC9_9BASI|nr:hypothetical protein VP01_775g2 [Puccinia sorghi]